MTLITDPDLATRLIREIIQMGATGYTETPCFGIGRRHLDTNAAADAQSRVEIIMPYEVCEQVLEYLRAEIMSIHHITVCVETVEVARLASFVGTTATAASRHSAH
jgi:hypothetical protein